MTCENLELSRDPHALFMNFVEEKALHFLKTEKCIIPAIYQRYIDDIIIGPFDINDTTTFDIILKAFNAVHANIQFTIDIPKEDQFLNFLDITRSVD